MSRTRIYPTSRAVQQRNYELPSGELVLILAYLKGSLDRVALYERCMTEDFDWSHHLRAQDCIAHGYLTNSKRPESHVKGVYPTHVAKGQGCYLWDTKGKKYFDFICGLGTNLLGYGNETIANAVHDAARKGPSLSFSTPYELDVAEQLKTFFPSMEVVRFLKTGTEACLAAVRIARAKTGSNEVMSEGYHGWSDEFVGLTPPAIGIAKPGHSMSKLHDYNQRQAIAIVEPVITDHSPQRKADLETLRKNIDCLIFDEVITGLRFKDYSVSRALNVTPDIICIGKALGNGFPIAAIAGKKGVMNCDEYFVSGTYCGDIVSLAAASTTLKLLRTRYNLDDLWRAGQRWLDEFNSFWPEKIKIVGYPTRGVFTGDDLIKALLFQECCDAGILFGPSWFFNFPLMEHGFNCLKTVGEIIKKIRFGGVTLRGEMPRSPFAQRVRGG
jgi:glutamate-1-semialdehyde aminotransferase